MHSINSLCFCMPQWQSALLSRSLTYPSLFRYLTWCLPHKCISCLPCVFTCVFTCLSFAAVTCDEFAFAECTAAIAAGFLYFYWCCVLLVWFQDHSPYSVEAFIFFSVVETVSRRLPRGSNNCYIYLTHTALLWAGGEPVFRADWHRGKVSVRRTGARIPSSLV